MRRVPVRLTWQDATRQRPGVGARYATVVRFDGGSPGDPWTLVVQFTSERDLDLVQFAGAWFLVDNGPRDLLTTGATFQLLEGLLVVARGEVLEVPA
jgi:hypothetical protein